MEDPQRLLLARIDAFLAAHKMTDTTFGLKAVNDGKFVGRLREVDANITFATWRKVVAFMENPAHAGNLRSKIAVHTVDAI